MESLQVELILAFLGDCRQVRPQGCFRNSLSIIVVILLPLDERLHINGRNNSRLKSQLAQGSADKVSAQARFHADNAYWELFESLQQGKSLYLLAQNKLAIIIKANQMKCVLADIDTNRHQCINCFLRHATSPNLQVKQSNYNLLSWGKQPAHPISGHSPNLEMQHYRFFEADIRHAPNRIVRFQHLKRT